MIDHYVVIWSNLSFDIGAIPFTRRVHNWDADKAEPYCSRDLVGWGITCCQNGKPPVCWCMFYAAHSFSFSAVLPKNTWHFRASKANSQTQTEPAPFHWDGVIPGHLLVRRPQRWARGEESMVYFGILRRWRAMFCTEQYELVGPMAVKAITENKETM